MKQHKILSAFAIGLCTALAVIPVTSHAQDIYGARSVRMSPYELDSLTAPIALYPDPLLADVLMAATYPLEVQDAADWVASPRNTSLRGEVLEAELDSIDWDPSIKALTSVPGLLQMMANRPDWVERLGDAFIAQEQDVMDSVQRLRRQAYYSGKLRSDAHVRVTFEDDLIIVDPVNPDSIYFSVYDPREVYGRWSYPDYPPVYLPPPVGYGITVGFGYGVLYPVFRPYWGWNSWDWRHHRINIDRNRWDHFNRHYPQRNIVGNTWRHDRDRRTDWNNNRGGRGDGNWRNRDRNQNATAQPSTNSGVWRGRTPLNAQQGDDRQRGDRNDRRDDGRGQRDGRNQRTETAPAQAAPPVPQPDQTQNNTRVWRGRTPMDAQQDQQRNERRDMGRNQQRTQEAAPATQQGQDTQRGRQPRSDEGDAQREQGGGQQQWRGRVPQAPPVAVAQPPAVAPVPQPRNDGDSGRRGFRGQQDAAPAQPQSSGDGNQQYRGQGPGRGRRGGPGDGVQEQ